MSQAQTYPDIIIDFDYTFTFPVQTVWEKVADFGGWGKWYPAFGDMILIGDGVDKIGCIRKFTSKFSGTVYEENELEKDSTNYVLRYGTVSEVPHSPFIQDQVVTVTLQSGGESETKLHAKVVITPYVEVSEEQIEKFKTFGLAGYKAMYDSLENYLKAQQQSSQQNEVEESQ